MPSTRTVLVADASHDTRAAIARALAGDAWTVESAASLGGAEARLARGAVDVVLADLGMSVTDDVRTLRCLRRPARSSTRASASR